MPIYLRRFYLNKLIDLKQQEKQQIEKANNKSQTSHNPNARPSSPSRFRK
tara:strand:- start:440 stop:589 length:150 start_codon:yes stop_codon:yes gene_type:complete